MEVLWFWMFALLLVFSIAARPAWPYMGGRSVCRYLGGWRDAPSGVVAGLALPILLFFCLGPLAVASPRYAAAP